MASVLDATPEEMQALRKIAQLRAAGYADEDIFSGQAGLLAGGADSRDAAISLAGITSSYNLGRGNLAEGQQRFGYEQMRDPYNVVAANQYYADQGGSPGLGDPVLGNVPQSPMSRYQGFVDSLLFPQGAGAVQPTAAAQPGAGQGAPSGPWGFESPEQATEYFRRVGQQPAAAAPMQQMQQQPAQAQQWSPIAAQQVSAQQLGAQLPGMQSQNFSGALQRGQVPGFGSLNEAEMGRLTPDQRAQYFGLVGSTGRVSDPQAAYQDYTRRHATRGAQAGGTSR